MITPLLARWRIVLPIILLLSMSLAVIYYKTRYASAVEELATFKHHIATLTAQKEAENALLRKSAQMQIKSLMDEHAKNLADLNLDRTKVTNNLKGSINEIRDSLTITHDAIRLRNQSSGSSAVREIQADTSKSAEAERNCNAHLATVIDACKITDIDYEALYNAWQRQCDLGLCE